jgi:hypothetical protein
MYEYINVVKFNNEYFEYGDVVAVTMEDGSIKVGSVVIGYDDTPFVSNYWNLALDISEKYHTKILKLKKDKIKNIQRINLES